MLFYEGKSLNTLRSAAQDLALHSRLRMSLPKEPFADVFAPGCGLVLVHGELERILPFMQELEGVRPGVQLALSPAPSASDPDIYAVRILPTHLYSDPEQLKEHLAKERDLVSRLIDEKLGETPRAPKVAPPATPLAAPERLSRLPLSPQRLTFAQRLRRRLRTAPPRLTAQPEEQS